MSGQEALQGCPFFAALTPERRHEVRILAKRLRYALDLFAVVLPKAEAARYIAALSSCRTCWVSSTTPRS